MEERSGRNVLAWKFDSSALTFALLLCCVLRAMASSSSSSSFSPRGGRAAAVPDPLRTIARELLEHEQRQQASEQQQQQQQQMQWSAPPLMQSPRAFDQQPSTYRSSPQSQQQPEYATSSSGSLADYRSEYAKMSASGSGAAGGTFQQSDRAQHKPPSQHRRDERAGHSHFSLVSSFVPSALSCALCLTPCAVSACLHPARSISALSRLLLSSRSNSARPTSATSANKKSRR